MPSGLKTGHALWPCMASRAQTEGLWSCPATLRSSELPWMLGRSFWGYPGDHCWLENHPIPNCPESVANPQSYPAEQAAPSRRRQCCLFLGPHAVTSHGLGDRNCGPFQRIVHILHANKMLWLLGPFPMESTGNSRDQFPHILLSQPVFSGHTHILAKLPPSAVRYTPSQSARHWWWWWAVGGSGDSCWEGVATSTEILSATDSG